MKIDNMKYIVLVLLIILSSCGDDAPMDYIPRNFVEAYLFVDQPIKEIKVLRSQPLNKEFIYEDSFIKDANVKIILGSDTLQLNYNLDDKNGYFYPDTSLKVLSDTTYYLEVYLKDGTFMHAKTHTPKRFEWIKKPFAEIYYPKDTLNLPVVDSLRISWTKIPDVNFFLLSVDNLDTLNYGKYLNPPTDEKNRRAPSFLTRNDKLYRETSVWNFIANNETPTVWFSFRWFGKHRVSIFAPDYNFLRWFLQSFNPNYSPILSNIEGGNGVFGSASVISSDFFLYKNQP